ncbi:MAG: tetratricopeptide repeat protein [Deltaproteobacteria bacterium]|nr:tetratricopeptide repeat protein [Deltaproteobacteria bacterium]
MRYLLAVSALVLFCSSVHADDGLAAPADAPTSVPRDESKTQPATADAALKQAESAYEYGDMPLLVESARFVTDGTLEATTDEQAAALRFLGIGLYVTGRVEGARTAFEKLLQLRPNTYLDPATTRPEIVTFFFDLRRRRIRELRAADQANRPNVLWNFVPPMGQFNNGDRVKGWILLVGEAVTLATAATTYAVVKTWQRPNKTVCEGVCPERTDTANTLRSVNITAGAAFIALYAYGVIDGLISRNKVRSEEELLRASPPPVSVSLLPNGAALNFRF